MLVDRTFRLELSVADCVVGVFVYPGERLIVAFPYGAIPLIEVTQTLSVDRADHGVETFDLCEHDPFRDNAVTSRHAIPLQVGLFKTICLKLTYCSIK